MSQRPVLRVLTGSPEPTTQPRRHKDSRHKDSRPEGFDSEEEEPDSERQLLADIEAVLLAAEEPLSIRTVAAIVDCDSSRAKEACAELEAEYRSVGRGFEIAHIAGGVRLQTTAETAQAVRRLVAGTSSARLSAAALETLAVVAYKQPVSRAQISAIRGVNADAVVRSLCERGYLTEDGTDPGPGAATLLRTTDKFLAQLGLNDLGQLPSLADLELDTEMLERLNIS